MSQETIASRLTSVLSDITAVNPINTEHLLSEDLKVDVTDEETLEALEEEFPGVDFESLDEVHSVADLIKHIEEQAS